MQAANRWETEAIRESRDRRRARPAVSQQRETPSPGGDWRTLREASDETGIPVNTLRKWCRRESVDSYLESDGEVTLRMLEMGSVKRHAKAMGRERESYQPPATSFQPGESPPAGESPRATGERQQGKEGRRATGDRRRAEAEMEGYQLPATSFQPEGSSRAESLAVASASPSSAPSSSSSPSAPLPRPQGEVPPQAEEGVEQVRTEASDPPLGLAAGLPPEGGEERPAPGTMIVPVDAWNKMLNQLGNLHEAGQQLAEARERAGKAETEAKFLRERLAEMRSSYQPPNTTFGPEPSSVPSAEGRGDAERSDAGGQESYQLPAASHQLPGSHQAETTSFFRYVVRGWKGRRR